MSVNTTEPEVSTGVYGELSAEEIEYYRNQKMKHAVVMGLSNFMLLALTLDAKVVRVLRV